MVRSDETNRAPTGCAVSVSWTEERHEVCAGFYSPETTSSQAALPSPSPLNMLCFQQVRDREREKKKKGAESCSAGIQYNFKMTAEESSGASEEDDWDLDADARLAVGWRSASHLRLYTDPTC